MVSKFKKRFSIAYCIQQHWCIPKILKDAYSHCYVNCNLYWVYLKNIHFAEAVEDIPKWHNVVIGASVTVGAIIALLIITVLIKRRTPSMRVVELGFCKLCRKKEEPEVDYVRMNE